MSDQVGRIEFGPAQSGPVNQQGKRLKLPGEATITILPPDYLQQQSAKFNEYKRRARQLTTSDMAEFRDSFIRDLAGEP